MLRIQHLTSSALVALAACSSTAENRAEQHSAIPSLGALLEAHRDRFGDLLDRADEHRIKIELAVVVPGSEGPSLLRDSFDTGPEYFYPASSVKTCAAIAALAQLKLESDRVGEPLGLDTPLRFHPLFPDDRMEDSDPSHVANGTITAGHDMRKVFLVSDNGAYNHLYELAGNERVNAAMRRAGLTRTRILHRLSEFRSAEDQLRTPRIDLLDGPAGQVLATIPARTSLFAETNDDLTGISIGTAHTRGDDVIDGPMSFARKNFMPLRELLDMNVMLLRPDIEIPRRGGFDLSTGERAFIAEAMAAAPRESRDPVYDVTDFPDDYSKFLAPGLLELRDTGELTVRDKVGRAYGFSVTNAEVVDARFFVNFLVSS